MTVTGLLKQQNFNKGGKIHPEIIFLWTVEGVPGQLMSAGF